jgi:alanyl-tRNA synthetase
MESKKIRELWSQFWVTKAPENRKHAWAAPASLIVNSADDPTTMFNTAGMQQFVPYLVGKPHPLGKRLYNIQ